MRNDNVIAKVVSDDLIFLGTRTYLGFNKAKRKF